MRTRSDSQISDSELELLKVMWDANGSVSIRDLHEAAERSGRDWAYNTVQTLANRLVEKGFAKSERVGRAFAYEPTVTRDELVGMQLGEIADRVCDGNASPLVLNLAKTASFTREELDSFRELLDELEADGGKPNRKGGE